MSTVEWQVVPATPVETRHRRSWRVAVIGMLAGAAIPGIPAAWGTLDQSLVMLTIAGGIGIPIGLVLGAYFGADARRVDGQAAMGLVGKMAILAVLIGDLVVGIGMTFGMATGGAGGIAIGILATAAGLIILGLPALLLTIPCAVIWILVMRLLPERLVGDGRRPIPTWSRRLPAVTMIVALASVGAVPFALAAADGRYCPNLQDRAVEAMAWSADGTRLVVATWDLDWESDRTILFEVQPDTRMVRVFHEVAGAVSALVIDPDGTTWWTLEDARGLALWSATASGAPVRHGSLDPAALDPEMGGEATGLWWVDGGLALDTWDQGPVRLDPGPIGLLVGDPIPTDDSDWYGGPLSASTDGTVVGWFKYGFDDDQGTADVAMIVIVEGKRHEIPLPGDTYDATVSADGRSIVFETDAGWFVAPLDGSTPSLLMSADWTRPSLMGDHAAAMRQGFQDGRLCFQTVGQITR